MFSDTGKGFVRAPRLQTVASEGKKLVKCQLPELRKARAIVKDGTLKPPCVAFVDEPRDGNSQIVLSRGFTAPVAKVILTDDLKFLQELVSCGYMNVIALLRNVCSSRDAIAIRRYVSPGGIVLFCVQNDDAGCIRALSILLELSPHRVCRRVSRDWLRKSVEPGA